MVEGVSQRRRIWLNGSLRLEVVCSVAAAAAAVAYGFHALDHNDFMYATSASRGGNLYRDLHFVQAPLSYFALRLIAILAPVGATHMALRAFSVLLTLAAVFTLTTTLLSSRRARLVAVALAVTSTAVLSAAAEIGSYAVPLLLVAAATVLVLVPRTRETMRPWHVVLAGGLVGLAASAKLSHSLFAVPLLALTVLRRPMSPHGRWRAVLLFGVGFIGGCGPLITFFLREPNAFLTHNVTFHTEFTYSDRGLTPMTAVRSVVEGFMGWMLAGGVTVVALAIRETWCVLRGGLLSDDASAATGARVDLAGLLAMWGTSFLVAAAPGVGAIQYLAPVGLFSALLMGRILEEEKVRGTAAGILLTVMLAQVGHQVISNGREWSRTLRQDSAVGEVHRLNRRLRQLLVDHVAPSCEPRIFTYAGAFVVDTGFPLARYTEAGIFWARLRGHVPERYLGTLPTQLPRALIFPEESLGQPKAPTVVVAGFYDLREPQVELAMIEAMQARHFTKVGTLSTWLSDAPMTVWVDPSCSRPEGPSGRPG